MKLNYIIKQKPKKSTHGVINHAFIKWAGGKSQLINQYAALFPKNFNNYFEPFLGSGAVFFFIKQKYNPQFCLLSDVNDVLINTFEIVRDKPEELLKLLKEHKQKDNSKEYFNEQRLKFNILENGLEKAAIFIYLNKTCFNGLYRVNAKGEFNVPFGKYKNPAILQETRIRKASELLQNTVIKIMHFSEAVKNAEKGDFVYLDPPYYPLSKTSNFTSYQKDVFLEKEQKELANVFTELNDRGCYVMLSNSETPFVRELYRDFNAMTVKARRVISCIGTGRGSINELVVKNY